VSQHVTIDFETRSECDLKKCGSWVYSEHPSTEILCMAWAIGDDPVQLWHPEMTFPPELAQAIYNGAVLEAHNAFFERSIWENIGVTKLYFPRMKPDQWRCSASRVAAQSLPRSLGKAAEALRVSFQKDLGGRALMLKMCSPKKKADGSREATTWEDDPMQLFRLYDYCKGDVRAERAVSQVVRELSETELKVWQLDQKINHRGILIDREGCRAAVKLVAEVEEKLKAEFVELTKGVVQTPKQIDRLLEWLTDNGTAMNGLTKAEVVQTLGGNDMSPRVQRVLEIRQQLARASTAKFIAMLNSAGADGRVRDSLMYHGAGTGRWAGKLMQPHNLTKATIKVTEHTVALLKRGDAELIEEYYPDVLGFVSSHLRAMLIPARGHRFIAADYAAIEARVLFWMAGEKYGIEAYRNKLDLYIEVASQIYPGVKVVKPSTERDVGKEAVLGCGFGMGHAKFKARVKEKVGIDVTEDFSKRIVKTYRNQFPAVPRFWYAIEAAAIAAVRSPGTKVPCGKVTWGYDGRVLWCQLPSGRLLAYNDPKIRASEKFEDKVELSCMVSSQGNWVREGTYGGKLVENVVQATARDIMTDAMLRLDEAGWNIALHCHDEIVTEEPSGTHDYMELEKIMRQVPAWATGCPIDAEGWEGPRYKK
jgi:DNA polymerase